MSNDTVLREDLAAVEKAIELVITFDPNMFTNVEYATCLECLDALAHEFRTALNYPNPEA
jgi:hypothetical protein